VDTVIVGLLLTLFVFFLKSAFSEYFAKSNVEGVFYDFVSSLISNSPPQANKGSPQKIVFVDFSEVPPIDDVVKNGPGISRAVLADFIKAADRQKAKVVLLDFSLYGDSPNNPRLKDVLDKLSTTDVIIPALITRAQADTCDTSKDNLAPQQRKFYDQSDLFGASLPKRVWIGTDDLEFDMDGRVRRLCPFSKAVWVDDQIARRKPVEIPSSALLAVALAADRKNASPDEKNQKLFACVKEKAREAKSRNLRSVSKPSCGLGSQLIRFRIASKQRAGNALPFAYQRLSATDPTRLDDKSLQGAIVVIGASHALSSDVFITPIGPMPGALVLANAIRSFDIDKLNGGFQPLDEKETLAWEVAFVIVGSLIFVLIHHLGGSWLLQRLRRTPIIKRLVPAAHAHGEHVPPGQRLATHVGGALWAFSSISITFLIMILIAIGISAHLQFDGRVIDLSGALLGMLFEVGARLEGARHGVE
jgi:CHASE2 domain-containing sensor protein